MARRPRLFAPGILYHVIVRGNYRQKTLLNDGDYQAYLERLGRYRKRVGVTVYAYCLMSNHVHLLVETGSQPLSRFMQGLQQSYTQYFNRKHGKVGHLFQGRYKAILCDKDEYLLSLVRYIHLNPIRAKIVHKLDEYRYSEREKKGRESFLDIRRVQLSKNKGSPLKDRPSRNPGQSLDEQIQDLVNDYMFWPMVFATIMILFAV